MSGRRMHSPVSAASLHTRVRLACLLHTNMIDVSLPAVWGLSAQSRRRGVACQRYDATLADRDCTAAWQFASTRSSITILLGTNTDRPPRPHLPHHFALACGPTSKETPQSHRGRGTVMAIWFQMAPSSSSCRLLLICVLVGTLLGARAQPSSSDKLADEKSAAAQGSEVASSLAAEERKAASSLSGREKREENRLQRELRKAKSGRVEGGGDISYADHVADAQVRRYSTQQSLLGNRAYPRGTWA